MNTQSLTLRLQNTLIELEQPEGKRERKEKGLGWWRWRRWWWGGGAAETAEQVSHTWIQLQCESEPEAKSELQHKHHRKDAAHNKTAQY